MVRSQLILLNVSLLVIACMLHFSLCDWLFNDTLLVNDRQQVPIWLWKATSGTQVVTGGRLSGSTAPTYTGVFTHAYAGRTESLLFGIVAPLLLVTVVVYLNLSWRRDARVARGLCAVCAYDLRGTPQTATKCPECGTNACP